MVFFNKIAFSNGIDIFIKEKWIGLHYYWQSIPLFNFINTHTKMNTVYKYGIILFGLWLYIRIDE